MQTHTRKLEPQTWRAYFDWMTRQLPAVRAEIEVTGLDIGDQIEGGALTIDGLSYDPSNHELVVTATHDMLEHRTSRTRRKSTCWKRTASQSAVEILDGEGHSGSCTSRR